jgi:hypothetical protein
MNSWFRVYNSLVDDPKVRKLPDGMVTSLLWLWCIAGQNDGVLPPIDDVAFKLRCTTAKAAEIITKLVKAELFDNDGGTFRPHNWDTRQYKTDTADPKGAGRAKKYRDKKRDASRVTQRDENVRDERPEQNRAESEQSRADAPRAAVSNSEKVLRSDLMEIFGPSRCPDLSRAGVWLGKGYSAGMIVEVVRELLARTPGIASLNYFDAKLEERHSKRAATPSERAAGVSAENMDWALGHFAKGGHWARSAGPEPGQPGCRATVEMLAKHGLGLDGQKLRADAC